MDAGAHYPSHRHSEIEELFVLSGDLHVEGQIMGSGDYCRADSATIHGETFTDSVACSYCLRHNRTRFLPEQDLWFALDAVVTASNPSQLWTRDEIKSSEQYLQKLGKHNPLVASLRN
jgi:hypothetical protein